ncbi:MAG: hypothetical protein WCY88_02240 [Spongiibacteraceae bacterium]
MIKQSFRLVRVKLLRCVSLATCSQAIYALLGCLLIGSFSSSLRADENTSPPVPAEVQDLRYGVILYHFFQQSYFEALTESMVGESRQDMPFHQQSAKLLRGGMSLSYGMSRQAEAIFTELIDILPEQVRRDQAWFYLTKMDYLRGNNAKAKSTLLNIQGPLPTALEQEAIYLKANLLLASGDLEAAAATIASLPETSPWLAYYYFNLGSKQSLSGQWQQGVNSFLHIDQLVLSGEEGKSLRDRAYTAAGFSYLKGGEYQLAITNFLKVRLDSPMVDRAMLGYGWAAAQQGDFELALKPWQALAQRSVVEPSVQEGLLAIPYAYEKLDARGRALQQYQYAITAYEQGMDKLAEAIVIFRDLPLIDLVSDDSASLGEDWIMGGDNLPINEQAPYLTHLIAQNYFQSAVKGLSDLLRMQVYLSEANDRLAAMQGVLEIQQRVWRENLNQSQRQHFRQQYNNLLAVQENLEQQQIAALDDNDARRFANKDELVLWQLVDHATSMLEQLKANGADISDEQEQLRLYRGLLYWQASEQWSARRWQYKKQLVELEQLLSETKQHLQRLETLDENRYNDQFALRIEHKKQRLDTQQQQVTQLIQRSEAEIRQLAIDELSHQRQRLSYYLGQAKLAVARLYDAGNAESLP